MGWKVEEIDESVNVLFVAKHKSPLVKKLKEKIEGYKYRVFISPKPPDSLERFAHIFIFNDKSAINKSLSSKKSVPTLILLQNKKDKLEKLSSLIKKNKREDFKIVNVDSQSLEDETLEKIFWFSFSGSADNTLNLERLIKKKPKRRKRQFKLNVSVSKKRLFFSLVLIVIFIHLFFIAPLIATGFFLYKSTFALKDGRLKASKNYLYYAVPLLQTTKKTYGLSRPVLSFFYLTLFSDDIISLEEHVYSFIQLGLDSAENAQRIASLVLKKGKNQEEKDQVALRLDKLGVQTSEMIGTLSSIEDKLNFNFKMVSELKKEIMEAKDSLGQTQKLLSRADIILGKDKKMTYLILFENNMELRPGGGFIGSFAVMSFEDYTLKNIRVEDVYEADGQLNAHVEPPEPIKEYLDQPHFYLRDSNFSPDFKENFETAQFFLEKELGLTDFDAGAAITTTSVKYLLGAFGDIYLPDYKEVINKDNFYIKMQAHVESDFFPGSIQKRTFLSSLVRIILLKLEEASYKDLVYALKRSLDEKQFVLYFKNEQVQEVIDSYGWNGRIVVPKCAYEETSGGECVLDVVFPVDANLGVNKANFFIKRLINLKVKIDEKGQTKNILSVTFKNTSPADVFPGGIYKNYFQVYLPFDTKIDQITKDGVSVDEFKEKPVGRFKIIGFYFEVKPENSAVINIKYSPGISLSKGKSVYQLIVQKQIGSANNDFVLEFYLPDNIYVANQNFSGLAKEGALVYNTSLSTDQVFFVELVRE